MIDVAEQYSPFDTFYDPQSMSWKRKTKYIPQLYNNNVVGVTETLSDTDEPDGENDIKDIVNNYLYPQDPSIQCLSIVPTYSQSLVLSCNDQNDQRECNEMTEWSDSSTSGRLMSTIQKTISFCEKNYGSTTQGGHYSSPFGHYTSPLGRYHPKFIHELYTLISEFDKLDKDKSSIFFMFLLANKADKNFLFVFL